GRRKESALDRRSLGRNQVRVPEVIAGNDFAGSHRNLPPEHRTGVDERMELSFLAAWVNGSRQIRQKFRVELTAGKIRAELFRVDAGEPRARIPQAIISCASSRVGRPHSGKTGCSPVPCNCFSRYWRTSVRNRSPNATHSIPAWTALR